MCRTCKYWQIIGPKIGIGKCSNPNAKDILPSQMNSKYQMETSPTCQNFGCFEYVEGRPTGEELKSECEMLKEFALDRYGAQKMSELFKSV